MTELPKKPAKPCKKRALIQRKGLLFTGIKVSVLIFLIVLCAALKRLGKLNEGECLWIDDLCGVISEVSYALLQGVPIDSIAIKPLAEPKEEKAVIR